MSERRPDGTYIVDEIIARAQSDFGLMIEKRLRLVIKKAPWWMPEFIYRKLVANVFIFEEYR